MTSESQEPASAKAAAYPNFPVETWWKLRKLFKKGAPRPRWDEDYLINLNIRQSKASASHLVRPFKRMGIFTEDGKPTDRYWDWMGDAKYAEVCQQILHEVYPEELTGVFTAADDGVQDLVENWFQRKLGKNPKVAREHAAVYMLLLRADVSEQDNAAAPKSRPQRAAGAQTSTPRPRSNSAKTQPLSYSVGQTAPSSTAAVPDEHTGDHPHAAPRRQTRGFEPSLNINVQIHIPAEATLDQIDQIFKSMSKHLYQRHDEAGE